MNNKKKDNYTANYGLLTSIADQQNYSEEQSRRQTYAQPLNKSMQNPEPYRTLLPSIGKAKRSKFSLNASNTAYPKSNRTTLDNLGHVAYTGQGNNSVSNNHQSAENRASSKSDHLDLANYSPNELRNNKNKWNLYKNGMGEINQNAPSNMFQILYGTWDRVPMYQDKRTGEWLPKPTGPKNRYDNYDFGVKDAMNWLIQTGGNVNFVLQLRDVQHMKDSAGAVDDWAIKDRTADWQAYIINTFFEAADILRSNGETVKMPKFYLGAAEGNPKTLIGDSKRDGEHDGIYKQVLSKLGNNRNVVAGAYYGEDTDIIDKNTKEDIATKVSYEIHETYGGQMLMIPFFRLDYTDNTGKVTPGDGNLNGYFNRAQRAAQKTHSCEWGTRPAFDTIIFQPGTYFYEQGKGLKTDDIFTLADKINQWNADGNATAMGMELEYDMGVVTGRDDENYSLRNAEKKERLKYYLEAVKWLNKGTPIGIYSGGPNEQGYANPLLNSNSHNTGNHIVQDSNRSYATQNGIPYNAFPDAYNGNFVYDMSDYVYRDMLQGRELAQKLKTFLYQN